MPRYKPYDYAQSRMLPLFLEDQVQLGTLEYAIHHIIEERIDLSIFDRRYCNDETGRKAINPKILLKVVLLGYSRGLISSRSIERACQENVIFMALACCDTPDHSTIAAFVSSLNDEIKVIFSQVLLICDEEDLLSGTHFSVDGLKLPSNASKEWSGKFTDLKKKRDALERKIQDSLSTHQKSDKNDSTKEDDDREDKTKKRLQKSIDRIDQFLKNTEPKKGTRNNEIQSNVTDNESAKMPSSKGVIQGYNANALVDEKNQVIVYSEAFGEGNDGTLMNSMLQGASDNLQIIESNKGLDQAILTADTGYFSSENIDACDRYNVDSYIPDNKFRQRDPKLENANRFRRPTDRKKKQYQSKKRYFTASDFVFENESKNLICPAGEQLFIKNHQYSNAEGYKGVVYQGRVRSCENCNLRSKCLQNPKTISRQVLIRDNSTPIPKKRLQEMRDKIDTPDARRVYSKRLGIVEPVFGNIRARKRMDHFTLRGKLKVNIQWILYSIVHNIEKLKNSLLPNLCMT